MPFLWLFLCLPRQSHQSQTPNERTATNKWALERRNYAGLCPDQLLDQIKRLEHRFGRVPTQRDFIRYSSRYYAAIRSVFGSWNAAVKLAGLTTVSEQQKQSSEPEKLLEYMRNFYQKHGRAPVQSDFNRGLIPHKRAFLKHFGSLNQARLEAGLPIFIPLGGGRGWSESREYTLKGPDHGN